MKHINIFTRDDVVRANEIIIRKANRNLTAKPLVSRTLKTAAVRLTREEINSAYAEACRLLATKS